MANEMTAKDSVVDEREMSGKALDAVSGGVAYNSGPSGPTLNEVMTAFYNGILKGLTSK
jgi:hypothetical protein